MSSGDSIYDGLPTTTTAPNPTTPASAGSVARGKAGALIATAAIAGVVGACVLLVGGDTPTTDTSPALLSAAHPLVCSEQQMSVGIECADECATCDIIATKLELGACTLPHDEEARVALDRAMMVCSTQSAPAPPAPTAATSAGGRRLADGEIMEEEIWQVLSYGFDIDISQPSYLTKTTQLFEITHEDVSVAPEKRFHFSVPEWSNSDEGNTRATKIATDLKLDPAVGGHHPIGPIDASATMTVGSNHDVKTASRDETVTITKQRVTPSSGFTFSPQTRLHQDVRDAIDETAIEDVQRISDRFGVFFASASNLGGTVRRSDTMQMTADDNTGFPGSLELELHGPNPSGGSLIKSGGGSFGTSRTTRENGADMTTDITGAGGDVTVWLRAMAASSAEGEGAAIDAVQTAWSESFTDHNLFPVDVEVRPIYELVQDYDQEKGDELKRLLTAEWAAKTDSWNPTKFFLPGCTDPAAHNYQPLASKDDGSCVYKHVTGSCRTDYCRDKGDNAENDCRVSAATSAWRHGDSAMPACAGGYDPVCDKGTYEYWWVETQYYICCQVTYSSTPESPTRYKASSGLCPWVQR
jgi:hypothetical protein